MNSNGCDQRCHCGRLVARLVDGGVEIKCRRCAELVVVPLVGPDDNGQGMTTVEGK